MDKRAKNIIRFVSKKYNVRPDEISINFIKNWKEKVQDVFLYENHKLLQSEFSMLFSYNKRKINEIEIIGSRKEMINKELKCITNLSEKSLSDYKSEFSDIFMVTYTEDFRLNSSYVFLYL